MTKPLQPVWTKVLGVGLAFAMHAMDGRQVIAQPRSDNEVVVKVLIKGNKIIETDHIMRYIRVRAGQLYNRSSISEDCDQLIKSKQFKDVRTNSIKVSNYVLVMFEIEEKRELTLFEEFQKADVVVVAHVSGRRELVFDEILKTKDAVKDTVKFGPESDVAAKDRFLVFGQVLKNGVDFHRHVELRRGSSLKEYVLEANRLKDSKAERYRHWFDHLNSSDDTIAADAHYEFNLLPTKELTAIARTLPAEKIAGWLNDPQTDDVSCQLYGFLLGNCGKAEHGKLLRSKIGASVRRSNADITGLLKGYVMLQPREGWDYVRSLLADGTQPLSLRQDALDVANFIRRHRSDLVDVKDLINGVSVVLDQTEFAAQGIDFLRRAKAWDRTDDVLALFKEDKFAKTPVPHCIVMFALQSPQPRAVSFIQDLRKRPDPNEPFNIVFVAELGLRAEKETK